jgi:hypothetical protein
MDGCSETWLTHPIGIFGLLGRGRRHRAVAAQTAVPGVVLAVDAALGHIAAQYLEPLLGLAAADDLADPGASTSIAVTVRPSSLINNKQGGSRRQTMLNASPAKAGVHRVPRMALNLEVQVLFGPQGAEPIAKSLPLA